MPSTTPLTGDAGGRAPFVSTRDVTKSFGGVHALRGASIDFYPGEVHCLAGENGCGKSTLMKVISGAHAPTSGTVVVEGRSYDHLTPRTAYGLGLEVTPEAISDNQPLFGRGLEMDSLDTLEVVVLVNDEFGVSVSDSDAQAFGSVNALADFILAKAPAPAAAR